MFSLTGEKESFSTRGADGHSEGQAHYYFSVKKVGKNLLLRPQPFIHDVWDGTGQHKSSTRHFEDVQSIVYLFYVSLM